MSLGGFYLLLPQKSNDSMLLNSGATQKWGSHVYIMIAQASLNIKVTSQHAQT